MVHDVTPARTHHTAAGVDASALSYEQIISRMRERPVKLAFVHYALGPDAQFLPLATSKSPHETTRENLSR